MISRSAIDVTEAQTLNDTIERTNDSPNDYTTVDEGRRHPATPDISLDYTPGFDGLRAAGVLVVLAYHHGVHQVRGGIFTVSMFFTLSGYLIATLALVEWSRRGRLSPTRFWERRARRLLPAASVVLLTVVALQRITELGAGARFTGDVIGALAYVSNWRFAYSGGDYGDIFTIEAPVQHFWSLAVEEQFYLVFPLLFLGLMKVTRGSWKVVGVVCGVGAATSFVIAWHTAARLGSNSGLAYYATYTRASEILVGVALAFLLAADPVRRALRSDTGVRLARWSGLLGLAGLAWLWTTVDLGHPFVFRGGTLLNATLTSLVILACTSPEPGRTARLLGLWPLRSVGRISYGIYLVHWPLFLLLDEDRTGLDGAALLALRVGATIGLAVAMYHVVEAPFRFRLRMPRPALAGLLGALAAVVVALTLAVPVHESDADPLVTLTSQEDPVKRAVAVPPRGRPAAARALLVGDSLSFTTWPGYVAWNQRHPDRAVHADSVSASGCSLGDAASLRFMGAPTSTVLPCRILRDRIADLLAAEDYGAVVVTIGHKDLAERRLDGEWRHLGDPVFDEWFAGEVEEWIDMLDDEGAQVLWSTAPHVRIKRSRDPADAWRDYGENDPARVDRLNEIVRSTLAGQPGFTVLEVDRWLQGTPGGEFNSDYRFDSVHYTEHGADELARWVVPQILAAT